MLSTGKNPRPDDAAVPIHNVAGDTPIPTMLHA
jgi:hypothetical protein